jgi:hypothetical protein
LSDLPAVLVAEWSGAECTGPLLEAALQGVASFPGGWVRILSVRERFLMSTLLGLFIGLVLVGLVSTLVIWVVGKLYLGLEVDSFAVL